MLRPYKSAGCVLAAAVAVTLPLGMAREFDHADALYGTVLEKHVTDGRVDYPALKANPVFLNRYLARLGSVREETFKAWKETEQLAFLINLYNAATLRLIINHYPVKSIKDIGGFFKGPWDREIVPLFGKTVSLDHLEHDIIRKEYNEPRIHMALVCAARGCPTLRGEPYTGARLDEQLDDQAGIYLKSPAGLRIDRAKGVAYVSAIFKWFKEDFQSVRDFVERHSGADLTEFKIRHIDYDWSLNTK